MTNNSLWLHFLTWILLWAPLQARAADDALIIEGSIGGSTSSLLGLDGTLQEYAGTAAVQRVYLPLIQTKYQDFRLVASSQFLDSKKEDATNNLTHYYSSTSIGAGLNYQLSIFTIGAEYQQVHFRQLMIGNSSNQGSFSTSVPCYFGGILIQLGAMGIGVIYQYKNVSLPTTLTNLTTDSTYEERNVMVTINYHFKGSKKKFFKSLFK